LLTALNHLEKKIKNNNNHLDLKGIKIKDIGERGSVFEKRRGTLKKGDTENTQRKKREREREKRKNGTLRTKKTGMFPLQIGFKSHVSFHVMHVHPLNKK